MNINETDPIKALFWRDEVLQIAYWFRGEGLGEEVTADELRRFLSDDAPDLSPYLMEMAADGWMELLANGRYRLTELGKREGGRRFADAFEGMTKPAHGECSTDCVCRQTGNPADCEHRQHEHVHSH